MKNFKKADLVPCDRPFWTSLGLLNFLFAFEIKFNCSSGCP